MEVKDRIVYLNDALSGLYGPKIRMIAQDIYRSRRLIYDAQKRKMNDEQLQASLQMKVDFYMKTKYKNKYGIFENLKFPHIYEKETDLTLEENPAHKGKDAPQASMADSIRTLRKVNLGILRPEKKHVADLLVASDSPQGKRIVID